MTKAAFKILVVDDSKIMRRIIASSLVKMGYGKVLEAPNVRMALEIIDRECIDLVICDYSMPGMSGLELLKAVRRDPQKKNTPFVMVTAEAQLGQIIAAFREGVQQYVTKPFTPGYLEYILNKTMGV
ncbi:MAG: response regulator [Deltaproteobacteria bacterium]|nr:response regulator [Deltaproteobacteria bacterium]